MPSSAARDRAGLAGEYVEMPAVGVGRPTARFSRVVLSAGTASGQSRSVWCAVALARACWFRPCDAVRLWSGPAVAFATATGRLKKSLIALGEQGHGPSGDEHLDALGPLDPVA